MKEQNFQEEHLHQNPNPNPNQDPNQSQGLCSNQIERFINTQVVSRGLDERTARAYRMDLEKLSDDAQVGIEVVIEYEDGTTETRFIDLY